MKKIFLKIAALTTAAIFVLYSCGSGPDKKGGQAKPFPRITVPAMMGQGPSAMEYIAKNYWRPFLDSSRVFSQDTSFVGGVSKEQFLEACREYAQIVSYIPLKSGIEAQTNFIKKVIVLERECPQNTVFEGVVSFVEGAFYGVNSDFRNEELYLPIAEALAEFEHLTPEEREKFAQEAKNCSKNRVGTPAADFNYTTKDGKRSSLYQTNGDFTILFFSNPGCTACKDLIVALEQSLAIGKLLSENRIAIINIFIDEDLTEWYKYMPIYPQKWINCYNEDLEIRENNTYDVRAIPSIYLLDSKKRVILKDTHMHLLLDYLNSKI